MSKRRRKNTGDNKGKYIVKGLSAGIISAALLLTVYALMISKSVASSDHAVIAVALINFISAFVSGEFAGTAGEGRAKRGLITGTVYAMIMLLLAAAINIDLIKTSAVVRIIACSIGGALIGSILHLDICNKKHRKKYKSKN